MHRKKVRVWVERSHRDRKLWTVRLSVGVQSFTLDYHASKQESVWYARMLRQALKRATHGYTKDEWEYIQREEALRTYDGRLS